MKNLIITLLITISIMLTSCSENSNKQSLDDQMMTMAVIIIVYENTKKPDLSDIEVPTVPSPEITIPDFNL